MVGQAVDVSRVMMMMMVVDASSIQVIQISAISGIYFTVCFVQNIINKFNFFFFGHIFSPQQSDLKI